MGRIESFERQQALIDRIGQLKSDGLAEDRMTVISTYVLEPLEAEYPGIGYKSTEDAPWERIVSWFQGEDPEDQVMDRLELTDHEKEEYRNHLEAGRMLLYIDYDAHAFYRFTDSNDNYAYQDPERPRRAVNLDHRVENDLGEPRAARPGEENMELRKEELVVNKEKQQVGEVVVNKRTDSSVEEFDVPVDHEEVSVERRSIEGEPLFEDYNRDDADDEEGVIRIPITEERIKIVKEHVVTEEVIIRKNVVTENKHISEVVHREDVDVTEHRDDDEKDK